MRILLRRGEGAAPYLGAGWSEPEPGHVWSVGEESWLVLPPPERAGTSLLRLTAWPHVRRGKLLRQRIRITVNGHRLGAWALTQRQTLACVLPPDMVAGKFALALRLRHPDAARPADFPEDGNADRRLLAVAYEEASCTVLSPAAERIAADLSDALGRPDGARRLVTSPEHGDAAEAVRRFQSIGDDCEFGFVQRHLGVEALGLFRFASVAAGDIARALESGFAGLAEGDALAMIEYTHEPGHDFMGRERTYGLLYHTLRRPDEVDAETLRAQERTRLQFLARKFLEDVALGEHLFVLKRKEPLLVGEVAELAAALRARGPATLLWVRENPALAGSAERLTEGVIAGYVDRFAPPPLTDISTESWARMCRSAHAVWTARGGVSGLG